MTVTSTIQTFYDAITLQRDPYENGHGSEVARLAAEIGELLNLPAEELILLKVAAHLHDVGKVGLPENILNKPGKYTNPERLMVQQHTFIGVALLQSFNLGSIIYDVVLHHHERFDGQGYPHQLRGETIPVHSAIVHLADVYDALTHDRPYRPAMSSLDAFLTIEADKKAYNPRVLEAFKNIYPQFHSRRDPDSPAGSPPRERAGTGHNAPTRPLKPIHHDPASSDLRGDPAPTSPDQEGAG